jgi:hypothetical protein
LRGEPKDIIYALGGSILKRAGFAYARGILENMNDDDGPAPTKQEVETKIEEIKTKTVRQIIDDAGFEATDPLTFRFVTNRPYSPVLDNIGDPSYPVIPREAVEKWGDLSQNVALARGLRLFATHRSPGDLCAGRSQVAGIGSLFQRHDRLGRHRRARWFFRKGVER